MEATASLAGSMRGGISLQSEQVSDLVNLADVTPHMLMREARVRRAQDDPRMAQYTDIVTEAMYGGGQRSVTRFREALSTAEFGSYFGDIIDRVVLMRFQQWVPDFRRYFKTGTFNDLTRTFRHVQFGGGDEVLGEVGAGGPYPVRGTSLQSFGWRGKKYGADFQIFWETILADDLNGLRDLPDVLASAARASEAKFATQQFVDANGPHATLYSVGHGNKGTAKLSITSLAAAVTAMSQMLDPVSGNPIFNRPRYLVVPPALEMTARGIVQSIGVTYAATAGAATPLVTTNMVSQLGLEVLVNPWIPPVAASANGDTSWFLFSEPNAGPLGPGIAAVEFDTLRGLEAPLLLQKRGEYMLTGGGADPRGEMNEVDVGSFRVIHPMGGGQLFYQATYGSDGSS